MVNNTMGIQFNQILNIVNSTEQIILFPQQMNGIGKKRKREPLEIEKDLRGITPNVICGSCLDCFQQFRCKKDIFFNTIR